MAREAWLSLVRELGATFAERAAAYDRADRFAAENYAALKAHRLFSLGVPAALGGGGASLADLSEVTRELAHSCPSTALAFAMHQHLVAALVLRHVRGDTPPLLAKVAERELVLVSTGASDWLSSNGSARRVEGGYRVTARKPFASGSPGADMLITSIASVDEAEGPLVLHFALPLGSEGVRISDDWHTLGMRATGSHTVVLEDAFVPDSAISLKRPRGLWHPVWNIVLGVAPPLYMAPYVGLAQKATQLALDAARKGPERARHAALAGELHGALTQTELAWQSMVNLSGTYDFTPSVEHASAQLTRKTLVAGAARRTVELACELAGGSAFYRASALERAFRDVQGASHHALPARRQAIFSGLVLLGEDPATA